MFLAMKETTNRQHGRKDFFFLLPLHLFFLIPIPFFFKVRAAFPISHPFTYTFVTSADFFFLARFFPPEFIVFDFPIKKCNWLWLLPLRFSSPQAPLSFRVVCLYKSSVRSGRVVSLDHVMLRSQSAKKKCLYGEIIRLATGQINLQTYKPGMCAHENVLPFEFESKLFLELQVLL